MDCTNDGPAAVSQVAQDGNDLIVVCGARLSLRTKSDHSASGCGGFWRLTSSAVVLSSPDVGSSTKSTEGFVSNSNATLTLFLCPPDMPRFSSFPVEVTRDEGMV